MDHLPWCSAIPSKFHSEDHYSMVQSSHNELFACCFWRVITENGMFYDRNTNLAAPKSAPLPGLVIVVLEWRVIYFPTFNHTLLQERRCLPVIHIPSADHPAAVFFFRLPRCSMHSVRLCIAITFLRDRKIDESHTVSWMILEQSAQ